ncbi:MAG: GDP-L-fucose synthase family protein [Gemmataceae bacterium]
MIRDARVYVAGRDTLLGSALVAALDRGGFTAVLDDEPDLAFPGTADAFFDDARPEYVFLADGLSGGIEYNRRHPATLMQDNLAAITNVLSAAQRYGVRRLLYLGSSCMYPRDAAQPMAVGALGGGPVEPTSAAYATAKYAGVVLCDAYRREFGCDFVTAVPANAFGPGDDFSAVGGHVIPALIRRAHDAKVRGERELAVWGSGRPVRDFLYAPDAADALVFLMGRHPGDGPVNVGTGAGVSVADLARLVCDAVGYAGRLRFDPSRPDGQPVKVLDCGPLTRLGWRPATPLRAALEETYHWFLQHHATEGERDDHAAVPRTV